MGPLPCSRSPFARPMAYVGQRAALSPPERPAFDTDFAIVLRRAVARTAS